MIHPELRGGSPHRASAGDGKKVANVIPADHGAIPHRAVRLPKPVPDTANSIPYVGGARRSSQPMRANIAQFRTRTLTVATGVSRPAGWITHHRCARLCTQHLTPADPFRGSRGAP